MATSFAFQEVKALARRPQRAQAQQLLERLAAAVLPILTRRRFRVRRLLEFFPKDGALLGMNVNRGTKIYVRLRPARDPEAFYPYEALLETLLHELTHMVHGPHNQAFYKYLDELKQEMEALMVRGLVGQEGVKFADAGDGQRLGGSSAGVPIRVAAVLAAKRREQYHSLLGGDPSRRLGSTSSEEVLNSQALRQKVLEAAERRRRDNEHCRNVLHEGASHEILGIDSSDEDETEDISANIRAARGNRQTISNSSATEVIVLDQDDDGLAINRAAAIINLIEEEENNDDRPRQGSSDDGALTERGRKRKRQEGSTDIIDLT